MIIAIMHGTSMDNVKSDNSPKSQKNDYNFYSLIVDMWDSTVQLNVERRALIGRTRTR